MKATQEIYRAGQSLWLDNITRELLTSGTLRRYIEELSVTGLTSNPTIFHQALKSGTAYDATIREGLRAGKSGEGLFFEIALADLTQAADLFMPVHERTSAVDGWVSLEVSPLLARDAQTTLAQAKDLHARAARRNLFIKIPGTAEGLPAIEEAIFAGVPINVTLLFSAEQYLAAAQAYLRGVERRIDAGLNPNVASVASVFISQVGRRRRQQGSGATRQHARHRDRRTRLQRLREAHRVPALAARVQCGRPTAAVAVCQHGDQGPEGVRHPVRQGTVRTAHDQHGTGRHAQGVRGSR